MREHGNNSKENLDRYKENLDRSIVVAQMRMSLNFVVKPTEACH